MNTHTYVFVQLSFSLASNHFHICLIKLYSLIPHFHSTLTYLPFQRWLCYSGLAPYSTLHKALLSNDSYSFPMTFFFFLEFYLIIRYLIAPEFKTLLLYSQGTKISGMLSPSSNSQFNQQYHRYSFIHFVRNFYGRHWECNCDCAPFHGKEFHGRNSFSGAYSLIGIGRKWKRKHE